MSVEREFGFAIFAGEAMVRRFDPALSPGLALVKTQVMINAGQAMIVENGEI